MGKVIQFQKPAKQTADKEALKLIAIADELDRVILKHIEAGSIDAKDMAGLLAHRLGSLVRHVQDNAKLLEVCEHVLKSQAAGNE